MATYTLSIILIMTLTPLLITIWLIFFKKIHKNKNPPGPHGLPLLGYLPFLGSHLHQTFNELAKSYGPIFKLRLGLKDCIVITSPSLIKEVLKDQDVVFANRAPPIASRILFFGSLDIAFSNYGLEWRKMRKIFSSEIMSNASLEASYHLRKQHMNKMINETYKKWSKNNNELVNIGDMVFVTLIGTVMSLMWGDTLKGDKCAAINAEFRAVVCKGLELLGVPNVSDFFPFLARFDLQGIERQMKEVATRCEEILDLAVEHHKSSGENLKRRDFLGQLLELTQCDDPTRSLTLPQVKAILMDAVIGGTDTSVTTVEWAMAELLQHPETLKKVQEELTQIVGLNSLVSESHLHKLKYLNAVVKETLRLHPPVPLLVPHCPSEPSIVGGYRVPKDARVFLNVYAIQRDPFLWDNPLLFSPERFLNGSGADKMYFGSHFEFIPFGSGRRMCPGMPLAERMSRLLLASLLHSFEWKLPNGGVGIDFSERYGIVMRLQEPLIVEPNPRLSNKELYSYQY